MSDERCDRCHLPVGARQGQCPHELLGSTEADDWACMERAIADRDARISALETLAHAAIELRRQVGTDAVYLPEAEAFDAAVKGAGL